MTSKEALAQIKGIFVPVVTPFNRRGDIDEAGFRTNVRRYVEQGFDGILIAGSTGEGPYLTERERMRLVEMARPLIPAPQVLMVGTGVETTRETIQLSREAVKRGADALLVLTPGYFKNRMDSAALTAHFTTVADSVGRPVLIYSIPQFTGINIDPETIARLSRHDNIAGLKESSGKMEFLREILKKSKAGFRVLAGSALIMLDAFQAGAAGAVLGPANYIPDLCLQIYRLYLQGDLENARKLQQSILSLVQEVNVRAGIPGIKYALDFCGYRGGKPRSPLLPLSPAEERKVASALRGVGIRPRRPRAA
ncbi:MAG: dihydrodipicolinate synthase family protein [Acidobacteria bacterium]|nr:MAG: dihydrodipicolinate synthase family protein [Acidobacteriota bacterium]